MHAQICPCTVYIPGLIASMKLATKVLHKLACTLQEAPLFLALEPESFRQQQLTCSISLPGGASFYVRSTCLCFPSQKRRPRIAMKGISCHNFRPVRFYRTPHVLNLAFIVKNTNFLQLICETDYCNSK